jgi:predicted nucleic acid-binding protein
MKFVVDTNIVFSAVLNTDGKIADLIMNSHGIFEFYTCNTLRIELKRHESKLLALSKLSEEALEESIFQITKQLTSIDESLITFEMWMKAVNLVRETDMDDVVFVALAEFLGIKLWTGDKELMRGLAKKGYTNFIMTDELYKLRDLIQ